MILMYSKFKRSAVELRRYYRPVFVSSADDVIGSLQISFHNLPGHMESVDDSRKIKEEPVEYHDIDDDAPDQPPSGAGGNTKSVEESQLICVMCGMAMLISLYRI